MRSASVLVVGAGVFGLTAAIALRKRAYQVTVVDPGPVPHPLAASTDISKAVRADYGSDDGYLEWMLSALDGWREYNVRFGQQLFFETGVTYLSRATMAPGGFEHDSYERLIAHNVAVERVDSRAIAQRFPAWNSDLYVDGYFNPIGGWAWSGVVVTKLADEARSLGVELLEGVPVASLVERGGAVRGVRCASGSIIEADSVLCCAGAWTPSLLPQTAGLLRSNGMPVFHLRPKESARELFLAERFPTFGADIAKTGWYGFPLHPRVGVVKIAHHGAGRAMHPESNDRAVTEGEIEAMRAFVRETFPALADAEMVTTRVCLYSDTRDGDLLIDRDPERAGLVIASGDSGHAFKFAPVLGETIADVVEGKESAMTARFKWREGEGSRREAARQR